MVPVDETILSGLRRGTVEYCVLALLQEHEWYGLDIARKLSSDGILMQGEGTLYPLLARLRKAGLVTTAWRESPAGPPRRYYHLTPHGQATLEQFTSTWNTFRTAVDDVLQPDRSQP